MRRSTLLLTFVLVTGLPSIARAQESPGFAEGQHLRIRAPGAVRGRMRATFVTRQGDTLLVRDVRAPGDAVTRVPFGAIERLEVRHRRSRGAGAVRGLWIGLVTGALGGGNLGFMAGDNEDDFDKRQEAALAAGVFAGAGLVIGPV